MANQHRLAQAIFSAIDDFNLQRGGEEVLEKSLDTPLFGKSSKLDSIGLVTLLVAVEERLEEEFGLALTIADEKAMSQKHSPFKTVATLAHYISLLMQEQSN
jgi:D-alanine--poly(phosphoribitol) ligase subunit 2